ncbi:MAG: histidinol-phosphate transaminase [Mycobacteriales bacterium]
MSVRTRSTVAALPPYRAGRSPADLARELGIADAIKLASNEVPFGPLPSVVEAIAVTAAGSLHRYPDPACRELTAALAARHGVSTAEIQVGPGTVGLCQHLALAFAGPGDDVVFAWRSFEAYPVVTGQVGARAVQVPLDGDHRHDLAALAEAVTDRTGLVFVCNPNNPTGTANRAAELEKFLDAVPGDVLVVLDEAYREFVTDPDVPDGLELARGRRNVAVLRTFSKAYGLASLRVGYCVANPEVVEALRRVTVPFAVNTLAQAAALASLEPAAAAELAERVTAVTAERDRVAAELARMGVDIPPESQTNFIWLPLAGEAGPEFTAACERRGVIVRPYTPDGVRVTIGTAAENDAFLSVVANTLAAR